MTRLIGRPRMAMALPFCESKKILAPSRVPVRHFRTSSSLSDGKDSTVPKRAPLATPLSDPVSHDAPLRPLRVLIVEDEAIIAMGLEILLEELGAVVVGIAMSATEAEELVAAHRPDCATMDISIKGARDGISTAQDILVNFGVRSIFVSAYGDAATRSRAQSANPIAWIRKPIDKTLLQNALAMVKRNET
ncbi:MAG: response regulator [Pseudomonadota bacterium]